jgi:hypothetical protein
MAHRSPEPLFFVIVRASRKRTIQQSRTVYADAPAHQHKICVYWMLRLSAYALRASADSNPP